MLEFAVRPAVRTARVRTGAGGYCKDLERQRRDLDAPFTVLAPLGCKEESHACASVAHRPGAVGFGGWPASKECRLWLIGR